MSTQSLVDHFHQFATEQLSKSEAELSIDALYEMWRASNPSPDDLAESVKAVKAALTDMAAGDVGTPAHEHLAELRRSHRIPVTE